MSYVLRRPKIVTETKAGEITINLNLTLTINSDGSVGISATTDKKKEESSFIIPNLEPVKPEELLDFDN